MASIYIYKTTTQPSAITYRYEISTIDSANVTMDQPVSPMALPQEDASENILVKMEGNTQSVNISWKVIGSTTNYIKKVSSVLTTGQITSDVDGTTPDPNFTWTDIGFEESGDVVSTLLTEFQGKTIDDVYWISFPNITGIMEGFMTRMDFSISGDSPVIWSGNISFIIGNVISMYDGDSPSEPKNMSATQVGNATSESGGTPLTKIRLRWISPTDTSSSIITYKIYRRGIKSSYILTDEITDSSLEGAVSGNSTFKEFAVTGLTSGDTYFFKISAVNSGGEGLKSNIVASSFP